MKVVLVRLIQWLAAGAPKPPPAACSTGTTGAQPGPATDRPASVDSPLTPGGRGGRHPLEGCRLRLTPEQAHGPASGVGDPVRWSFAAITAKPDGGVLVDVDLWKVRDTA